MRNALLTAGFLALFSSVVLADKPVDYLRDVKPILARRCFGCHGPVMQNSALRLDTAALMQKGGDSGPVVKPGRPAESLLIERVTDNDEDFRMPPEGKPLTAEEITLFTAWIRAGAPAPVDEKPQEDPRTHWSFQPPVRPPVPQVKNIAWVRNPIDAFIAAEHQKRGLRPRPPAQPEIQLRRIYLDLIGLPPTREQLHEFLADVSPEAYEKVVDRLLSIPQYGERWGRHWMDVWRYSDWYGRRPSNEIRYSQRHIWRWRDWIVESLNAEKGYDRMIVEMLAGDEIAPMDEGILRATGFLGRNWYKFDRNVWLSETVEQTSMGLLAVTMKCARCHDHKFDPLTQQEYYRFRAFFEPHAFRTDRLSASVGTEVDNGKASVLKDGLSRVFDAELDRPTFLFVRGDDRHPDKDQPLSPGVPAVLGNGNLEIRPVSLPVESYFPALRPEIVEEMIANGKAHVQVAQSTFAEARATASAALAEKKLATARADLASLEARIQADRAKLAGAANANALARAASQAERRATFAQAEQAVLQTEQLLAAAGDAVKSNDQKMKIAVIDAKKKLAAARKTLQAAQKALAKEDDQYQPLGPVYPRTSTGRRLALARWITDPKNPRTARVAVNHIWLRHFGRALVSSVSNFGLSGRPPSHPELLDWLAVELTETGWRMKHLHRLIVTSNIYRMRSSEGIANPNATVDPDNLYLWRMNFRRMEAELVRDSLLAVAGQLDQSMGGPELDEKLGQTSRRRSLYFRTTPDNKMELLQLFDLANPNECYRRRESVVPQQALALTNSAMALNQARLLARDLSNRDRLEANRQEGKTAFITAVFEAVLGRSPSNGELAACRRFLSRHTKLLKNTTELTAFTSGGPKKLAPAAEPRLRARENLVHVLFSHNDFVTIR